MDVELTVVLLSAMLPIYPALLVIYQKIGKYDVMCEDLGHLQEEHARFHYGEKAHGPQIVQIIEMIVVLVAAISAYWRRTQKIEEEKETRQVVSFFDLKDESVTVPPETFIVPVREHGNYDVAHSIVLPFETSPT